MADVEPGLVAAGHVLRRRRLGDHLHEGLARVSDREQLVELGLAGRPGRPDVGRGEDPPGHRDQVGQEVDRAEGRRRAAVPGLALARGQAGFLLDLGHVAVAADGVGLHALVDLTEHQLRLRLPAGSRDAALGIDHHVAQEARPGERGEGQDRGRGIAAGRADDPDRRPGERAQLGSVKLRQAVHGARQQVRPGMLEAIPARIVGRILEPEVRAEVDHRGPLADEGRSPLDGRPMGQGQEDGVGSRGGVIEAQGRPGEMGVDGLDGFGAPPSPDETDQLHGWMPSKDADQLGSRVSSSADHRDPNRRGAIDLSAAFRHGMTALPRDLRSPAPGAPRRGPPRSRTAPWLDHRHDMNDYTWLRIVMQDRRATSGVSFTGLPGPLVLAKY